MMGMMGHGWALHAIIGLVISTAFLVWVGGKGDAPYAKFGKVIAWIAVVLTGLMVIGSIYTCATQCGKYGMPCMRGGMMMEKGGMPMEPMGAPPPPPEKK